MRGIDCVGVNICLAKNQGGNIAGRPKNRNTVSAALGVES